MSVSRSTISFTERNWKYLKKAPNKSKIVNKAIEYYINSQKFLKQKEEEFIINELKHFDETGEFYTFEETFNDKKK